MDLRRWLQRNKPDIVKAHLADGTQRNIPVPLHAHRWRAVLETIATMGAVKVEALDKAQNVLSAVDLEQTEVEEQEKDEKEKTELQAIATIMPVIFKSHTEGCDAAAARQADTYRFCFDMLFQFAKMAFDRAAGLERAYHKLIFQIRPDKDPEDDSVGDAMAMDFLKTAMGAHAAQESAKEASGASKPNGKPPAPKNGGSE